MSSSAAPPHRPCEDLEVGGLDDEAVHRFLLGQDDSPQKLTQTQASETLGDPFAQLVLLAGTFPENAEQVLAALRQTPPEEQIREHQFFLVGESSQIPHLPEGPAVDRRLRFLVTCGRGPDGPDIMLSTFHPDQDTVELMAWDRRRGGFNFYRTVGPGNAWVFAGNSRHALVEPTRDNGVFESHKSGHLLMRELRVPWVHWHSPLARIAPSVLQEQGLHDHPWLERLAPGGAYTLEDDVAIPAIRRWTQARMQALVDRHSDETPRRVLEQLLTTQTVNLASSRTSSDAAVSDPNLDVDLPQAFFVDDRGLATVGLDLPDQPFVSAEIYANSLDRFQVTLTDKNQFERPGDTHFAFVVPERALEDTDTIKQAIEFGVLTRRLVACLLMVDFPNPIFSAKRQRLFDHVPDLPLGADSADFSVEVAEAIRAAPQASSAGTAEHEFAQRWEVGEDFEEAFNKELKAYFEAFGMRLETQEGLDAYMRLAESRRAHVRDMPIAESPLLFATAKDIPRVERHMRTDGTVEEA